MWGNTAEGVQSCVKRRLSFTQIGFNLPVEKWCPLKTQSEEYKNTEKICAIDKMQGLRVYHVSVVQGSTTEGGSMCSKVCNKDLLTARTFKTY